jgi:hypothetical protein
MIQLVLGAACLLVAGILLGSDLVERVRKVPSPPPDEDEHWFVG